MVISSRRTFLGSLGVGALAAGFGTSFANASPARRRLFTEALDFGELEPLAALIQETSPAKLQAILIDKIRAGTTLDTLIAAASLANARSFGGHDYEGYHCMMALGPALEMSRELAAWKKPLPVLKVIYRTAGRIQKTGGRDDALTTLGEPGIMSRKDASKTFREAILARDVTAAEEGFAALMAIDRLAAYEELQIFIQENLDVHKVVLAWRAWEALNETGDEHALTLLRQSVRFCVDREAMRIDRGWPEPELRTLRPELIERCGLANGPKGTRTVTDDDVRDLCKTVFSSSKRDAAKAMAAALADGFSLHDAGEALSLASNMLLLYDPGRRHDDDPTKPRGSVHGASVGVHAADSARAWRNIAGITRPQTAVGSLIAGAYHTGGKSDRVGRKAFAYGEYIDDAKASDPLDVLAKLCAAVEDSDQKRAMAAACAYLECGHDERALFDVLLDYGVAADGALHAEKYYRTVREEYASSRRRWRWDYAVALARVTASEYGWEAPGQAEAREALQA